VPLVAARWPNLWRTFRRRSQRSKPRATSSASSPAAPSNKCVCHSRAAAATMLAGLSSVKNSASGGWPKRSATAASRRGLEKPRSWHYCENMKNVTVSLDDDTYRAARVRAAEMGRSLSALVRDYLRDLGSGESEFERLHRKELELRKKMTGSFRASDRLGRDEIHERKY